MEQKTEGLQATVVETQVLNLGKLRVSSPRTFVCTASRFMTLYSW
jgi:hypothetical protein